MIKPQIHDSWKKQLAEEFNQPYFMALKNFLVEEKNSQLVFPPGNKIFAAFDRTPFEDVKVVILGLV